MSRAGGGFLGVLGLLVAVSGCDTSDGRKSGASGAAGAAAGTIGAVAGTGGGGAPAAPGTGGGQAAGQTGAAGTAPASDAGAAGTGGAPASGVDAAVERGGVAGAPLTVDAAVAEGGAGRALPKNVLVFTRSAGGYRHESIEPAAAAIKAALAPMGVTAEVSDDLTLFTSTGLARFGALVLVSTSGKAFGDPGTAELGAMSEFVKAGGGLFAIHAATATAYDLALPYIPLLGGKFIDHPGGIRTTMCFSEGSHPAVAQLPPTFSHTDEIYTFRDRRADSQVVVQCFATDNTTKIPISWHHREGAGRVFNTAMGHGNELWTANALLLKQHVIPGILWTLGL